MNNDDYDPPGYSGRNILITGGLGMIGSTLALRLVDAGARVTLVDACLEPYGANRFNIDGVRDRLTLNIADIRDRAAMRELVRGQDVIFNMAGQVSHNDSLNQPFLDADINYIGHLNVLECVRQLAPEAVVVHPGSRLQFGRIERVPVNEDHPLRPCTPYALNKTAAENMYAFYHQINGLRTVAFRIANPFGPRSQMRHSQYSIVNWFMRQAMEDRSIKVFGDGAQVRDYIYVEDLAEAFLTAALNERCWGGVFNVGSGVGIEFREMVRKVVATVKRGHIQHVPWPENYVNVETGDYVTDITKLTQLTGWRPRFDFDAALQATHAYYSAHGAHYF